jgi:hypothetical protein
MSERDSSTTFAQTMHGHVLFLGEGPAISSGFRGTIVVDGRSAEATILSVVPDPLPRGVEGHAAFAVASEGKFPMLYWAGPDFRILEREIEVARGTITGRPIRPEEAALLRGMLRDRSADWTAQIPGAIVKQMTDGAQASLQFASNLPGFRRFGRQVAEAVYTDDDGTHVKITINVDENGDLFELDVWKVNDTPLTRFPTPNDILLIGAAAFPNSIVGQHEILQSFAERAIVRGGGWYFRPSDACEIIRIAKERGAPILGYDGFFLTGKWTQPSMDNSWDFSLQGRQTDPAAYDEAIEFIGSRPRMYFEIVLGPSTK